MRIRQEFTEEFFSKGFTPENDHFQRASLANRLTSLYKLLEQGTVSILDARWGSGKTMFARTWKYHLENHGVPAIYFDAFATDYVEDPFRAVASAFVRAAKEARAHDSDTYDHFLDAASRALKAIAGPATKIGVKALTLGLVGASEVNEFKALADNFSSDFGEISESAVKAMLEDQAKDEENFKALSESLGSLPGLLAKKLRSSVERNGDSDEREPSLVVIIDELDRCRPDFALGILEVLKHFFRAHRVHFVLVTNLEHLLLSVNKRYGVGDAAGEYIQKFYDFIIPFEERPNHRRTSSSAEHASRLLNSMLNGANTRNAYDLIEIVKEIITSYDLSLRQAERVVINLLLAQVSFDNGTYRPNLLVAFLTVLKAVEPTLFRDIKRNRLSYSRLKDFVESGRWSESGFSENLLRVIRYHSDPNVDANDAEFSGFGRQHWNFNFESRLDILPYIANSVIDRFG